MYSKIIARDLWLVASRLYGKAVTRPRSRAAVTVMTVHTFSKIHSLLVHYGKMPRQPEISSISSFFLSAFHLMGIVDMNPQSGASQARPRPQSWRHCHEHEVKSQEILIRNATSQPAAKWQPELDMDGTISSWYS